MLEHVDSPYIRCIGFLYLRYAADPATLWSWFEPYLHDEETVQIRQGQADTTVGKYVQMILNDLDYYGTRLPRLPLAIERQFKVKLLQAERVEERAKHHLENKAAMDYFQKTGARIQALYGDDENPITWYDAVVERVVLRDQESGDMLARPKFQVMFPEYGNRELVTLGEVDLPGSNDAKRPGADSGVRSEGYGRRSERDYCRNDRDRDRGYGSQGDGRGRRGYDDCRYDPTERDARGIRGYPDDRARGRESRRQSNHYDSTDREHGHERSRSRDRGDNLNDARREEKELMEEVLRRERDKTAAKGRAYAARPATFKDSLGSPGMQSRHLGSDVNRRPREIEGKPKADRNDANNSKLAAAPVAKKTAEDLAAIEEKKRKLAARYG
mmetsp:Transcript_22353/g.54139  ORF Transcript_22353/g.54139 Transcript_22353/m.54139 type:complete len:385 (+) Transcript_22353:592-1746(+)